MKILIVETDSFGDGREPQIRPLIKYVYRLLKFNRRIKATFQEDKGDRPRVSAQNVTNTGRGENYWKLLLLLGPKWKIFPSFLSFRKVSRNTVADAEIQSPGAKIDPLMAPEFAISSSGLISHEF
jgi:hypothetical protein